MTVIKYIILGIIQGISEPLPISSSGHIYLFKHLFNTNLFNSLNFEIVSNFGSFIAIFIIFWHDIIDLLKAFFSFLFNKNRNIEYRRKFRYCLFIIISTIPVGITGLLFKDILESEYNVKLLSISFLITALALFAVRNINGKKEDNNITIKDAIIIGLLQAITIVPGISRSGTVLVGCLLCKFKRETALKYTFILYFPVSLASMLLGANDLLSTSELSTMLLPYSLGLISAGIVTYYSYKWLSKIVKNGNLWKFSIYCVFLTIFILVYFR